MPSDMEDWIWHWVCPRSPALVATRCFTDGIIFLIFPTEILDQVLILLSKKTGSFKIFPFWSNHKKSSKRIILYAIKGGSSPTELMPGLKLYNNNGVITKKAKLLSEEGIFRFL